ncbi:hypothetical protein [Clostridium sp. UBA4395]
MDKEMMLNAVDIVRSVSDHQKGFKKILGRFINKINYIYYKMIEGEIN